MLNIFRKKCICGMKEEKGKGITVDGKWFCCEECLKNFKKKQNKKEKSCCC